MDEADAEDLAFLGCLGKGNWKGSMGVLQVGGCGEGRRWSGLRRSDGVGE